MSPLVRRTALVLAAATLAGCAAPAIERNFESAQALSRDRLGAELRWLRSDEARAQAQEEVQALLAKALSADDAVRIALAHSPALQAALFDGAAASAAAAQQARPRNPVFAFERLVRREGGERDLDIGRMLSVSLLDLLLLPARTQMAQAQQAQVRAQLAGEVAQAALDARRAWVQAVAAQESLHYFEQVKAAADASAELARRMQAVGNFSKLQRAREQAFAAEAVAQLALAQQAAVATREALVRALGLDDAQAAALKLPERLPDLPAAPRDAQTAQRAALDQRLDVQRARAELELTARAHGLSRVTGVVDGLHLGGVRNSETGRAPQKGFELELPLPLFDTGDAARAGAQAAYMAALNRTAAVAVQARSQVRETYAAYSTAYDLARHWRDEIVPLRKTIAEENLLRYNGMLIGVFELLADAREQIGSVVQAIGAQRDFWLADAALQAALLGRPAAAPDMAARPAAARGEPGGH